MLIKQESSPVRCEICHQSDLFNPATNFCARCHGVPAPAKARAESPPRPASVPGMRFDKVEGGHLPQFVHNTHMTLAGLHPLMPEHAWLGGLTLLSTAFSCYVAFPHWPVIGGLWGAGVGGAFGLTWFAFAWLRRNLDDYPDAEALFPRLRFSGWKPLTWSVAVLVGTAVGLGVFRIALAPSFSKAVLHGTPAEVRGLLALGSDPSAVFDSKPALNAALEKNPTVARDLIEAGADVTATDKNGRTPLLCAADFDRAEMVNLLLARGSDAKWRDVDGFTPLLLAVRVKPSAGRPHGPVARMLLEKGADPNVADPKGKTPLMYAAEKGDVETVKALLDRGAKPNEVDWDGYSALVLAERLPKLLHEKNDTAKLLLERGADPNLPDKNRQTPLMHAVMSVENDFQPVLDVLAKGADVNAQDRHDRTALSYAGETGKPALVNLLIENGADLKRGGEQVLLEAAKRGHAEIVAYLIEHGVPVNATDRGTSYTPLMWAVEENRPEVVKVLLDRNAMVNVTDRNAITLLMKAVLSENLETTNLLLAKGADVNAKNREGQTPLMLAARFGAPDMVKLLLSKKPRLDAKDEEGDTVLTYAEFSDRRSEVMDLLVKAGAK